ncbi:MAG: hypothetical protein MRERV_33c010 [Mycoplasmataceae bacterium RV_VA103A]|nr:MAG: hypothetical protein MRERV_33c010 [Mycoplasmataceae bacterium RV_VA103A]
MKGDWRHKLESFLCSTFLTFFKLTSNQANTNKLPALNIPKTNISVLSRLFLFAVN